MFFGNWFLVVFYTAKIQNWKQFTTEKGCKRTTTSCVLHCKDTKLKAIHNASEDHRRIRRVVFYTAKIQNWKQFTTWLTVLTVSHCCVLHCKDTKLKAIHNSLTILVFLMRLCFTLQRYKIESNSQVLTSRWKKRESCVLHCKDTKLKAIHNRYYWGHFCRSVVFYTAKIQNWKQFTTFRCTMSHA